MRNLVRASAPCRFNQCAKSCTEACAESCNQNGLVLLSKRGVILPSAAGDPEGATLYEGGKRWGYTPITLTYPAARYAFAENRCLTLNATQVRWASGATASNGGLQACPATGSNQQYVFVRPSNAPGAEIDASFAIQLQRNGVMQQQEDAQDAIAVSQFIQRQKKN